MVGLLSLSIAVAGSSFNLLVSAPWMFDGAFGAGARCRARTALFGIGMKYRFYSCRACMANSEMYVAFS